MTFNYFVFKNFKVNAKRYLAFFICNSFAIMIFFMYSTLLFNKDVSSNIKIGTQDMLTALVIALMLFTVSFLGYSYESFLKSRNSELGLFMVLGMTSRDISRMVWIENITIVLSSLLSGLISGMIFARIFFMVITDILKNEIVRFQLSGEAFIFSIGTFLIIFGLVMFWGRFNMKKLDLGVLLKYDKKAEKSIAEHPFIAVLGIVLIISAFFIKYANLRHIIQIREESSVFTVLCFSGLYLFIDQFGSILMRLISSRRSLYYKNLLAVTGLKHRINRSKTALYIMSMLSSITMFFLGTAFTRYLTENGSLRREELMLLFISIFLAVLFFSASGCIIYFKLFTEIDEERNRYRKLLNIGILKKEAKKYISAELKLFFFVPCLIGILLVSPFTYLDNANSSCLGSIMLNFTVVIFCYVIFQTVFYILTKNRYFSKVISVEQV